jgi:2,5-diamino-6-(ribosylamino)-4(3H)-pyrimidinone 5'-phosphate reductase
VYQEINPDEMLPRVIIHNSISLDGSLTGFEVNMALHYQIAAKYKPDAHLIGSNTIKVGIELYGSGVPTEEKSDFEKQHKSTALPYWVIPDTQGTLKGLLHTFRRFEFCRDVIVLISEKTPKRYLEYLRKRNYDHYIVGKKHVDLREFLALVTSKYEMKTILTDTGRILSNLLLNQGLVSEISLLVHPVVVGRDAYNIFTDIKRVVDLELLKGERLQEHFYWLTFRVTG